MIRCEEVRFRYPHQEQGALNGLTMAIPEGGVTLVSGPTGCGKSTLGLALAGAIPQVIKGRLSGRITVGEISPTDLPLRQTARRVGLLLQNVESQMVTDRVEDEVAFGLENLAVDPRDMPPRIEQSLAAVQAEHLRGRLLASLSAGERQRVMLAAMLSLGQQVLIFDEPLAYLDRRAAAAFLDLAVRLGRQGKTCLIMEHRRQMILPVAHREVRLDKGRISEQPPAEVAAPPLPDSRGGGKPALAWEGLSFGWPGEAPLFQDLCGELRPGQSLVLLGDNGAGKTTLLKLTLGLLNPQAGRILVNGAPASSGKTRKIARTAALVLQNPDHQVRLPTVYQEVSWGAADPEATAREIQALGLAGLEERHPHSLSSGQKRRVTLAAALARRPRLLLLDEPTVGQDDANLAILLRRLGDFVMEGGALLTATHDVRAARCLGQMVLALEKGRAVQGRREMVEEFFAWGEGQGEEAGTHRPR